MNFALLAKAKAKTEQVNEEFNVEKYLNKVSKLSDYMDIYMVNDPIDLIAASEEFDKVNCFSFADPNISLKEMFGG